MSERITVVIPTYNRPELLPRCFAGLDAQTRPADRVIAVVRLTDTATRAAVATFPNVDIVDVHAEGVVAALNAGARSVPDGIIVFTDDDAVGRPSWLANIEAHYLRDNELTGVGGRDIINAQEVSPEQRRYRVGTTVLGRPIGNHHLGAGPPREVDVLKGVNSSYRRAHLRAEPFDIRLRGSGGHHHELVLGNELISQGRRLLYDPDIVVDHYPAPRTDGWRRGGIDVGANEAFNEQLAFVSRGRATRLAALAWGLALGTPKSPGVLRLAKNFRGYDRPLRRLVRNTQSRVAGALTRPGP